MTDINQIMNLYRWELDSLIKGTQMAQIDERERLAVLAASIGYFSNAKNPTFDKIFNREKEERALEKIYHPEKIKATNKKRIELYNNIRSVFSGEGGEHG